jgi:PncC family amidohydrolase
MKFTTEKKLLEITKNIHSLFKQHGHTLSIAESCTGGLISHLITSLPGASSFFGAGVVSYSAEAKKTLLNVSSACISRYGVVSEQTARQMAEKVRGRMKTDFSLATTGNLGPDVLEGKQRGLIYIAASTRGVSAALELRLKGSRRKIKEEAALLALQFLLGFMEKGVAQMKKSLR